MNRRKDRPWNNKPEEKGGDLCMVMRRLPPPDPNAPPHVGNWHPVKIRKEGDTTGLWPNGTPFQSMSIDGVLVMDENGPVTSPEV